jgi:hypothetical protein
MRTAEHRTVALAVWENSQNTAFCSAKWVITYGKLSVRYATLIIQYIRKFHYGDVA